MLPTSPISRPEYAEFIYQLTSHFPSIRFSTLAIAPPGLDVAYMSGMLTFGADIVLCVSEWLDFSGRVILRYSYEVSRAPRPFDDTPIPHATTYCLIGYEHKDVLYWYDSWPHPNDPTLASTHPHHKHVHPNIKRNRIIAPNMSFTRPNFPVLIEEIEQNML